jgi:hypothetical protein
MQRFLALCGVGVLVVVLLAGTGFGKPPGHQHKPSHSTPTQTPRTTSPKTTFSSGTGGNTNGGSKTFVKKKKPGKPKPGKKTGGKKKNKKHKKHHKKHHKRHKKDSSGTGGDDGGGDDAGGGDTGGGDAGGDGDDANGGSGTDDANDPEVAGQRGLLITDLEEDGPAAVAGLDVDDTILSVNGTRVQTVEGLRAALRNVNGPVNVVYISDDTGNTEDVKVVARNGRIGVTMDEVELQ